MPSASPRDQDGPSRLDSEPLRRHILWLLLIRVGLFTLLIGVTILLHALGQPVILPPTNLTIAFVAIIFIYSIGSATILQKTTLHLERFGLLQVLADILFAAILVYGTGCSQSIFTAVFIFPVISAGLILYRQGGLLAAATAVLLYALILGAELQGMVPSFFAVPPYRPQTTLLQAANLFSIYGLLFFLVAVIAGLLAGRLRQAEQELTRTTLEFDRLNLLYKQIFADITTGIITVDENNCITSYNMAAERITGMPIQTIMGKRFDHCFPGIALIQQKNRQVSDLQRGDGKMIRVGYCCSRLNMPRQKSDNSEKQSDCKVITLQDISKIEQMEQQVREAEKMAAIGELSASIAHDFRNPLAAISGSAQILALGQLQSDPQASQALVDIILRESRRMAKTINEFLQFARPADIQGEWFDLGRLLQETMRNMEQEWGEGQCRIQVDIEERLACWGDRQQIQTVLTHILENSYQAGANKPVEVRVRAREQNGANIKATLALAIDIIDNGRGIDPAIKERVFQPFFSTREEGSGLGLAICQQIIDKHHGTIDLVSEPGHGCQVHVLLPLPPTQEPA